MQHGDSDVDFRLDPRILQLPIFVNTTSIDDYYAARGRLLSIFSPSNTTGQIKVTTTAWVRTINVKVLGGLTFDTDARGGTHCVQLSSFVRMTQRGTMQNYIASLGRRVSQGRRRRTQ